METLEQEHQQHHGSASFWFDLLLSEKNFLQKFGFSHEPQIRKLISPIRWCFSDGGGGASRLLVFISYQNTIQYQFVSLLHAIVTNLKQISAKLWSKTFLG